MKEFETSNPSPLLKEDIKAAALSLKCEPAAIEAVSLVEAPLGGFIKGDNRPTLLFESHAFHTLTKGEYDNSNPSISTPSWVHNYGPSGPHQYDRLYEALALNREAALESASWGKYQIMGSNFYACGAEDIEEFVKDMVDSESSQLDSFVCFVTNQGIDKFLKEKDWTHFALRYNGAGQVEFYVQKIEDAYLKAVSQGWNS